MQLSARHVRRRPPTGHRLARCGPATDWCWSPTACWNASAASLDLPAEIGRTRALHPREAARGLADIVLEVAGPTLADDATLLVLDWHGGHGDARDTTGGAEQERASAASAPLGQADL